MAAIMASTGNQKGILGKRIFSKVAKRETNKTAAPLRNIPRATGPYGSFAIPIRGKASNGPAIRRWDPASCSFSLKLEMSKKANPAATAI